MPRSSSDATGRQHRRLKDMHRALRGQFPEGLNLRVHRSLSWLQRAEIETDDEDAAFIFYWISFNAAYASEVGLPGTGERRQFSAFFTTLVELDREDRIYDVIWDQYPNFVRSILNNRYVYQPFWNHLNGVPGNDDWEQRFRSNSRSVERSLRGRDTARILVVLFERLYVLRNQLIHGGATWQSSANREQVRGGRNILSRLTPIFLELMLNNPGLPWAGGTYPVVPEE